MAGDDIHCVLLGMLDEYLHGFPIVIDSEWELNEFGIL